MTTATDANARLAHLRYCALRPQPERALPGGLAPDRARAILAGRAKWVNGTVLHYYFFDRDTDGRRSS